MSGHGGYGGYGGGYGRSFIPYVAPAYGYGYYAPSAYGYGSGYGNGDSAYGYAPQAPPPGQIMDFVPEDAQPAPPPAPDDPSLQVYQSPAPVQTPQDAAISEGRYYLIAYKDHSVYTALAFWMENGALNYVTPQNVHNQISLDLLDMDLTKTLNARRGLSFNIVNQ